MSSSSSEPQLVEEDLGDSLASKLIMMEPIQQPSPQTMDLKLDWLGTSQFDIEENMQMQLEGRLDGIIKWRKSLVQDRDARPYDPYAYLELGFADNGLGFCDIAAGNGYRALVLIQSGLGICKEKVYPPKLGKIVRDMIAEDLWSKRVFRQNPNIAVRYFIDEELEELHLQAWKVILSALIGCAAFYDGCALAKEAIKFFPGEPELMQLKEGLGRGYAERREGLKEVEVSPVDIKSMARTGKIYQKPYPWMPKEWFHRTAGQIDDINKGEDTACWEIKSVIFEAASKKKPSAEQKSTEEKKWSAEKPSGEESSADKGSDLGPLGVFAKRNIKEGEVIMIDKTIIGVSDIPSSKGQHCDACHAALVEPFIKPKKILRPKCCGKVTYCSQDCHNKAMARYHKLLCKKDFQWVYDLQDVGTAGEYRSSWKPIMFLRLMAMVVTDIKHPKNKAMLPLQHPLICRMAANYSILNPDDLKEVTHDWQFFENVVAPTRILMELGVDVYLENVYQPEVIQTIYWRFENNANMATTSLTGSPAHMVSLNPHFLFINHSCDPNVSWHGAVPNASVSIWSSLDLDGNVVRPGSSTVWCMAAKDIEKEQELKISYIGDPLGEKGEKHEGRAKKRIHLEKWFEHGCGCALCEKENAEEMQTR